MQVVVRGLGVHLSARKVLGVLCNSWGASVGVLVGWGFSEGLEHWGSIEG